jgi:hypothetical protein
MNCRGCGAALGRPGQRPEPEQRRYAGRGMCWTCYRPVLDAEPRVYRRDAAADWVALQRAIDLTQAPRPMHLTLHQRGEAIRFLTVVGLSAPAIAERVALSQRAIVRWRRRLRAAGQLA